MKRPTRILLGISVALITAASLHYTVGDRFHHRAFGRHHPDRCGGHWGQRNHDQKPEAPVQEPVRSF